jgi:putative transposase
LTSSTVLRWAADHGIEWHYVAPGKPIQNVLVDEHVFALVEAWRIIEAWRTDYNTVGPARRQLQEKLSDRTGE